MSIIYRSKSKLHRILAVVMAISTAFVMFNFSGFSVEAEGGHVHNAKEFTAITSPFQITEAGNYYLTADVSISTTWNVPTAKISLDLNGHSITMTGGKTVIFIGTGANLNLYDCQGTGKIIGGVASCPAKIWINIDPAAGGGVTIHGGKFTMYGGNITGNTSGNAGGVIVSALEGSSFVMNGGKISGNTANYGGGIYVCNDFVMNGGEISGNTADTGGGILGQVNGRIIMNGGEIKDNVAASSGSAYIGWQETSFTINGGSITGNTCGAAVGAIHANNTTDVVIKFGEGSPINLSGNISKGVERNLDGYSSLKVTGPLSSGSVIKTSLTAETLAAGEGGYKLTTDDMACFAADDATKHVHFSLDGAANKISQYVFTAAGSLPTAAGNYYLTQNVSISSTWNTFANNTRLCLCGHNITMTGSKTIIEVNSGKRLEIFDCQDNGNVATAGKLTGGRGSTKFNTNYDAGAIGLVNGTFILNGGNITGCSATDGGALRIGPSGTFIMNGGHITNNTASYGGAMYSFGNVTINDGEISGNSASALSGALLNAQGTGHLTINGGVISQNKASANTRSGGGVGNYDGGTLVINGGEISYNTALGPGGGVYNEQTTLNIYGGVIKGNTSTNNGGGVYSITPVIMHGGTIEDNSAVYGGGIFTSSAAPLSIYGGLIEGNSVTMWGGGIYSEGVLTITGGEVRENSATQLAGGIYVKGNGSVIRNARVTDNYLTGRVTDTNYTNKTTGVTGPRIHAFGAGIYEAGTITYKDCVIKDNKNIVTDVAGYTTVTSGEDILADSRGIDTISGKVIIGDLSLLNGTKIKIDGSVAGSSIGVQLMGGVAVPDYMSAANGTVTSDYNASTGRTDTGCFHLSYAYENDCNYSGQPVALMYRDGELVVDNHVHNWQFMQGEGSEDNKAYAYCGTTASHCDSYADEGNLENAVAMTLTASSTFAGNSAYNKARVSNTDKVLSLTGEDTTLTYYLEDGKTLTGTEQGAAETGAAPVAAGKYVVKAAVSNVILSRTFTIGDSEIVQASGDNFGTLELSNKGKLIDNVVYKDISGYSLDNTSVLKISLTDPGDEVAIYKLAEMSWNSDTESFDSLEWVDEVDDWLNGNEEFAETIYRYPEDLANSSTKVWKEFYNAMLVYEGNLVRSESNPVGLEAYDSAVITKDAENLVTTVEGLTIGQYGIVASNGGSVMNPVVVNIVPQRFSPNGTYYLAAEFETNLKESLASIEKTINEKHADVVAVGDEVSFRIVSSMPAYYLSNEIDEATNSVLFPSVYYIEDRMDDAFALSGEIQVGYRYSLNGESQEEMFTSDLEDVFEILTDVEATDNEADPALETDETLKVAVDIDALRNWLVTDPDAPATITDIVVTYAGRVTRNVEINSDNNYNKAYLYFATDKSGETVTSIKDMIHAYTYGLKVIKADGDKMNLPDTDPSKFIAGAQFDLFRELTSVTSKEQTNSYSGSNYYIYNEYDGMYRIFEKVVQGEEAEDFKGSLTSVANSDGVMITGLKPGNYILSETVAPVGYNRLAEDIMFSIVGLTDEEAVNLYGGSYKVFKEADGALNENGFVSLTVLNFKGITLPATGGVGTLIFTLFGAAIMTSVIVVNIYRRKRNYCVEDWVN